ncbi:ribosome small subunit-dependent GTPase A [Ferviditalea candida]|uniref:Small ribosomal subunit biogenesis GTPase RsgA n=1 Tax=Ferviditalea candida TaxID=3108399 RepID=A0ABU5ZFG6_9BACL|nr:ribosome small subunit-dependent GTPase A [Paenibacillaceae bacterium T2]
MPEGLIIKALSGYYYVLPDAPGADSVQCRARGVFKIKGIMPLVGDRVIYETEESGEGTVVQILPRTSELIRPPISNVNLAVLIFSLVEPDLNLTLLDKFLVHTESSGVDAVICLSKLDLLESEDRVLSCGFTIAEIRSVYEQIGYEIIPVSIKTKEGVQRVRDRIQGSISVFAGQSGVGKSSLLNAIMPRLQLETGSISMRLGRGKHTTRHVELLPLEKGGFVADSPGFSQLDFMQIEAEELGKSFREFGSFASDCKFRGCLHAQEPGCAVIRAKQEGRIAGHRYANYLQFLQEIKDRKRRY